jgi:hypothetical protein
MKVKLSYTVDLDDVPNEVSTILNLKTNLKYDDMMNSVYESLSQKNYLVTIDNIDLVRKKLSAIDMVLNDCHSILTGYTKALVQQGSTNEQTDGE